MFQNLVGNAIKYQGPAVPRVHISAARNGAKEMDILGAGQRTGNRFAVFERIFGMFQRLHNREEFAGTGIGLAICKKIVERHGGSISVESNPDRAPRFTLPWQEASEVMTAIGGDDMPMQVLLVEDSPGDVRLTQEAFRDADASIRLHVASDGVEAMAFLRHEGPHATPRART